MDPYYAVMYWQIFSTKGIPMKFDKKVEISFRKVATSNLEITFSLTEYDIENAITSLMSEGKYEVWHDINAIDENKEHALKPLILVQIRNKKYELNIL